MTAADITSLPPRLMNKLNPLANGCWEWTGYVHKDGYGSATIGNLPSTSPGEKTSAHRVVYEALVSLIPAGKHLDHLCHDPFDCTEGVKCEHRRCVNPAHMAVVTPRQNSRRTAPALSAFCARGHELTPENSNVYRGYRQCLVCRRLRAAGIVPRSRPRPTICNRGHQMTPENTYTTPGGIHECRICKSARRAT